MTIISSSFILDFPGGASDKESTCLIQEIDARGTSSFPGSERSLGVGNGNLLWYSCLGNHMDRRPWKAKVHGVPNNLT